jgi:glyoxylase-like metal-dependent hydrolase (beta-lactamase superfamily II)
MRLARLLLFASLFTPFAQAASTAQALVDRSIAALGGEAALSGLKSVSMKGISRFWEPEQSHEPGGAQRFGAVGRFEHSRDTAAGLARTAWVKDYEYPAKRTYTYTETVTPDAGHVAGIDSTTRTRFSRDANPPQHPMSRVRLAAAQRELARTSPTLLLEMRAHPAALKPLPDATVNGQRYKVVGYAWRDQQFQVMIDPQSGLPARIRTRDADSIQGDSDYDLVLSNWREVEGAKVAHGQDYELNGETVVQTRIAAVAPIAAGVGRYDIPAEIKAAALKPATGGVPYQWVLRRQHLGVYLDSDGIGHDSAAGARLTLAEIAPGVSQTQGGTHNTLIVELDKYLVAFDAPIGESQAQWTIEAARAKYPGKPIRYLVLTHHHMDHTSGTRTFVAVEGATLVVGKGSKAHYEEMLRAPHRIDNDLLQRKPRRAAIVEVAESWKTGGGKREVAAYLVPNPHSEAMLIGYVPDQRLGFVTDLWSPGRDPLGAKATPGQNAVVAAVRRYGLTPERFAGGHGSTGAYPDLEKIADAK